MNLHLPVSIQRILPITLFFVAQIMCPPLAGATEPVTVGGPFTLIAPDGETVTNETYRGKWLLVYFGYTSCPDSCPTALLNIANALAKLGADTDLVKAIFITIDPRRDTPKIMGDYTQSFGSRILGLTGTPNEIDAVTQAYGAYFIPRKTGTGPNDYLMDHSVYIYLMNPLGEFVRAFDVNAAGSEIASALRVVIADKRGPNGQTAHTN